MELSANPKRLPIRYLLFIATSQLGDNRHPQQSLLGKSNNLVTFRSFVFPPMSAREMENRKTIP
jgi:hypothetical protein